jgi:hypothetical protein
MQHEVVHRNTVAYTELKLDQEKKAYERWLEN